MSQVPLAIRYILVIAVTPPRPPTADPRLLSNPTTLSSHIISHDPPPPHLPIISLFRITAPPEKAKDEYDPIDMAEVKCIPSGFTKWDRTWIDKGALTLAQFLAAFKETTGMDACTTK